MRLRRPRQKLSVERSLAALATRSNTLGIAPTGAGKTIMLSAVTGENIGDTQAKACVLAHRDELTAQNREKFARVNPGLATSVLDATTKSWDGQVTFAMVPTLAREANLVAMPKLDLLVIDEAHHAVAASYRRIVDRVRDANPDARIFGVTATPRRSHQARPTTAPNWTACSARSTGRSPRSTPIRPMTASTATPPSWRVGRGR